MHESTPRRKERWGVSIILLHWATVACVVVLLITGWQLGAHAAHIGQRTALLQWHASIGITLLLISIVRLFVRLFVKRPVASAESRLRRLCVGAIQMALYLTLLALIVTGIVAAAPRPFTPSVQLFGIWPLPRITGIPPLIARSLPGIHAALVWTLVGFVGLHVLAAIYGTFIQKDGTILRMLPSLGQSWDVVSRGRNADICPKPSSGDLPKVTVMGRAVAIAVLAVFLVLAGALLSIPFWVGGGVQQLSTAVPMTFRREIGNTKIEGRLAIKERLSFDLSISVDPGTANTPAPVPTAVFDMTDHPMPPLKPTVARLSGQHFAARGSFPMPGRWQLQVILPQGRTEIQFDLSQERRP
jgi:cytochrome b561